MSPVTSRESNQHITPCFNSLPSRSLRCNAPRTRSLDFSQIHPKSAASSEELRGPRVTSFSAISPRFSRDWSPSLPSLRAHALEQNKQPSCQPVKPLCGIEFPLLFSKGSSKSRLQNTPLLAKRRPRFSSSPLTSTASSSADRYVPARRSSNDLSKTFRTSRSPDNLSRRERLLRNSAASQDPFSPPRQLRNQSISFEELHQHTTGGRQGLALQLTGSARAGVVRSVEHSTRTTGAPISAIPDGRGHLLGSGTNAPIFTANFFPHEPVIVSHERFENKLAAALDIDQTRRILHVAALDAGRITREREHLNPATGAWWFDSQAAVDYGHPLLDAPSLRDDFYCSVLAVCSTTRTLAVGLANKVYLWSEERGVSYPCRPSDTDRRTYVASLSFSSGSNGNSILAIGRSNGVLTLWALDEEDDRFNCRHPNAITCVAFKPLTTKRYNSFGVTVNTEELLVGDETGVIYYYSIEWETSTSNQESSGDMTLAARVAAHTQQICGLAWSPNGEFFASGGNDNVCLFFAVDDIMERPSWRAKKGSSNPIHQHDIANLLRKPSLPVRKPESAALAKEVHERMNIHTSISLRNPGLNPSWLSAFTSSPYLVEPRQPVFKEFTAGKARQKWIHAAAIKAIAFCPWQSGLLAVGGGSNDRAIHFYHTWSGACLATIDVMAQVTSLIWSQTRREIVATFGYPQPEHPYRIAVFSWPDCRQILAIPWYGDTRALYAIPYPGGPNDSRSRRSCEGERWWKRTDEEGSIVIASSDECVKFHEVWSERARKVQVGRGGLGWSDILEGLEGVDNDEEIAVIR